MYALEISLVLMGRELPHITSPRYARFELDDSMSLDGYDWLWSQFIAIPAYRLIETFEAVCCLTAEIRTSVAKVDKSYEAVDVNEFELDEDYEAEVVDFMNPDAEWKAWLRTIHTNIVEHTNLPGIIGGGHRSPFDSVCHRACDRGRRSRNERLNINHMLDRCHEFTASVTHLRGWCAEISKWLVWVIFSTL